MSRTKKTLEIIACDVCGREITSQCSTDKFDIKIRGAGNIKDTCFYCEKQIQACLDVLSGKDSEKSIKLGKEN